VDEVTYCSGWDRAVKHLADTGALNGLVLVLTGSDTVIIRDARVRLPGRRGRSHERDFHLFPLSLFETLTLKGILDPDQLETLRRDAPPDDVFRAMQDEFRSYLFHGGYMTAINEMAKGHAIPLSTLDVYSDWIRGDVLKRGKSEQYLREILQSIITRIGSQVTWNSLSRDLSIDHPATVADYVELLSRMDVVFVQSALREDRLAAAPKKARKVIVTDPFVFHAVRSWLAPCGDPFSEQIEPLLADTEATGRLVETCVTAHFSRRFPTFYIKAQGEVDIAYVREGRFWPLEVKWTTQIRPKDLRQLAKYPNARLLVREPGPGTLQGIPLEPISLALARLGPSPVALPPEKK
jgi:predicted AAA+ superfamily ATPase